MKHLVLYGDSLLARMRRDEVLALEAVLENRYLITNAATSGFDTGESLARASVVAPMPFNYILVSLGTNDAAPWRNISAQQYAENVKEMVELFEANRVVFFLPPPINESKQQEGPKVRSNVAIKEYSEAAKVVLQDAEAKFIDSFSVYQELIDTGVDYHVEDGVHLNDAAYAILGQQLNVII